MTIEEMARHCMICNDVYYHGERLTQREYHRKYTNKDYTTGIRSRDDCIETYLEEYVKVPNIAEEIRGYIKAKGW